MTTYGKPTHKERVLHAVRNGGTDIRDWPPGFRLAARVKDLRDDGWDIRSKMISLPGGTKVARYWLET